MKLLVWRIARCRRSRNHEEAVVDFGYKASRCDASPNYLPGAHCVTIFLQGSGRWGGPFLRDPILLPGTDHDSGVLTRRHLRGETTFAAVRGRAQGAHRDFQHARRYEVVEAIADELAERVPDDVDALMTAEVKSIPLAHALAVRMKLPYVVARKTRKPYMVGSISVEVLSITTGAPQTLWLDGKDRYLVNGKRILLVDDVISTGSTLAGMRSWWTRLAARWSPRQLRSPRAMIPRSGSTSSPSAICRSL